MNIPYVNLIKQSKKQKKNLIEVFTKTLNHSKFVLGDEVEEFEKKISKICKTKYAIALNSGTDALVLGLHLLNVKKGDEVITPPNSFISSASSIVHLGAKPVFADVLNDQNIDPKEIEKKITKKTKAIMCVHLTGRISKIDEIILLSKKYKIPLIEDAAQSIGSKFQNKFSGSFGDISCFSTHPLKNLNACGDGGFILTSNYKLYKRAISLRNHGMVNRDRVEKFGYLSRMDTLQAAILNYRLKNLNFVINKRRSNAQIYEKYLDKKKIFFPKENKNQFNTYHTFVIQAPKRDKLKKYLLSKKINTSIHYPIPIHLQPAARYLGYKRGDFPITEEQSKKILSLPINEHLKKNEIIKISNYINRFYV